MEKFTIKAAFKEFIERLVYQEDRLVTISTTDQYKTIEFCIYDTPILAIKDLLNSDDHCYFEDELLIVKVKLSLEELEQIKEGLKSNIQYHVQKIQKWCTQSEENKEQINGYIDRHNIKINTKINLK